MDFFHNVSRDIDSYTKRPLVLPIQALESESVLLNRLHLKPIFEAQKDVTVYPWTRVKSAATSLIRASGQRVLYSLEEYPVQCIVTRLARLIPQGHSDLGQQERANLFQSTLDDVISDFVDCSHLTIGPNHVDSRWPTIHLVVFHRMERQAFVDTIGLYPLAFKAFGDSVDITYTFVNMSATDEQIEQTLVQPLQRGCAILREWAYYLESNHEMGNYAKILNRHRAQALSLATKENALMDDFNALSKTDTVLTRESSTPMSSEIQDERTVTDGLPDAVRIDTLRVLERDNWFLAEHGLLKLAYAELSIQELSKNPSYVTIDVTASAGVKTSTVSDFNDKFSNMLSISLAPIYDETLPMADQRAKFAQKTQRSSYLIWNSACDFFLPVQEIKDLTNSSQKEARLIRNISYPVGLPRFTVYPPYWSGVSNHIHPSIAFLLMLTDARSISSDVLGWHFRLTHHQAQGSVPVDMVFKRNIGQSTMTLLYRTGTQPDQVKRFTTTAEVSPSLISQIDSIVAETVLDLNDPSKCTCDFVCIYEMTNFDQIQSTQFYYDRCMGMSEAVTHPNTLREPRAVQRRFLDLQTWRDTFDQIPAQPDFGFEESVKTQYMNCAGLVVHDNVMFLALHQPMKVWTGTEIGLRTRVTRLLTVPIYGTPWLVIDPPHQTKDSQIQIYNYSPVPPGLYSAMQSVFVRAEFLEDIVHIISRASQTSGSQFHFSCQTRKDAAVTSTLLASHLVLSQGWFSKGAVFRVASTQSNGISDQLHAYKECVFFDLDYSTVEIIQAVAKVAGSLQLSGVDRFAFTRIQSASLLPDNPSASEATLILYKVLRTAEESFSARRTLDDVGRTFGPLVPTESTLCLNRDILHVARSLSMMSNIQWDSMKDLSDRDFVVLSRLQKLGTLMEFLQQDLSKAIGFDVPLQLNPEARVLMLAKNIKEMEPGIFSKRVMQTIFAQQGSQELLYYQKSNNEALQKALVELDKLGKLRDDIINLMDLLQDALKKTSDFDRTDKRKIVDALEEVKTMLRNVSQPELTEFLEKSKAGIETSLNAILGPTMTALKDGINSTLIKQAEQYSAVTKTVVEDSVKNIIQPALATLQTDTGSSLAEQTNQYITNTKEVVAATIDNALQALRNSLATEVQKTENSTRQITSLVNEVKTIVSNSTLGPSVDMTIQQIKDYKQWWYENLRGSTLYQENYVPDDFASDRFFGYISTTQIVTSVLDLAGSKLSWQYINCQNLSFQLFEWTSLPRLICQFVSLSTLINGPVDVVYSTPTGVETKRFSPFGTSGKALAEKPALYLVWQKTENTSQNTGSIFKSDGGFKAYVQQTIPGVTFGAIVESMIEQAMRLRITRDATLELDVFDDRNSDRFDLKSRPKKRKAGDDDAAADNTRPENTDNTGVSNAPPYPSSSLSSSSSALDTMETSPS